MREIKFRGKNLNTKEWVYEIYCNGMMEKQLLVFMDNSLMMVIILMKTMIKHLMLMKLP